MNNTMECETPMSDHVARFWKYLETETVRVLVDLKRTIGHDAPDGPSVYWDGASFSDDVAKALVAERTQLRADLATFGKDTEATENRIIDTEFKAQEFRTMLLEIREAMENDFGWGSTIKAIDAVLANSKAA